MMKTPAQNAPRHFQAKREKPPRQSSGLGAMSPGRPSIGQNFNSVEPMRVSAPPIGADIPRPKHRG